jgi:hypothetical protein
MERRFVLNVAVREGTGVLELLANENQTLLFRTVSFLVFNLGLDVVDGIGRLDVQGDGLSGERHIDEDLHSSTNTENQVKRRFLLNVVVRVGTVSFDV